VSPACGETPGHPYRVIRLLAHGKRLVPLEHLADRRSVREAVGEGLDAGVAEGRELPAPLVDQPLLAARLGGLRGSPLRLFFRGRHGARSLAAGAATYETIERFDAPWRTKGFNR
jgi:hypothetical protein